ncbi:MAG: LysR family transcriptional regulator [Anaerolineales bacterium]|jgi:DNA-binding transcriptional LysR family regulator
MSNLNVHQLNVFLAAAETLNFTRAAEHMEITQPSVSQHIQSLEEHFDLSLFVRSGRNIELTEAGLALIPLAREMVYLSIHIEETMASLKGDVYGHLIVGCSTSAGRYLLPKLLASLHTEYPQVRATCRVTTQAHALKMLQEGKVHLALASSPPFIADIEFRKVTEEAIILITPLEHPWAQRDKIELSELVEETFILPEEGSEIHSAVREALSNRQFSIYKLDTLVYLGSLEAIALSVQEGLGVGFLPELIVDRLVKGKVKKVPIKNFSLLRGIFVARNKVRPSTAAQDAFWELIVDPATLASSANIANLKTKSTPLLET